MVKESPSPKKSKGGRPKGSKSVGIPLKGIKEAIVLVKMAYEKGKDNIMSFSEISEHMGLQKGSNTPTMGALSSYGLVEQSGGGWKISDLGMRAINGEKEAIRTAFEKIEMFRDLSSQFAGKNVSQGLVLDYIKKKYKKGDNAKSIAQRFLEGMDFIGGASPITTRTGETQKKEVNAEIINLIKLKYALNPPQESEVSELAEQVYEDLKENSGEAIKILAENINANKNNKEALKALVESLLGIVLKKS